MTNTIAWLAAIATIVVLVIYEVALAIAQRRNPAVMARTAHANLREEWFAALSGQKGSEILAVQTIRNSMMSATMTASTAVLGLLGTITLAAPSLHASFGNTAVEGPQFTVRLALELVLIAMLFASLVSSVMAVRYFNHAGYIGTMPVGSEQRLRWEHIGSAHVKRAGLLYSRSLRHLIMIAPVLASILHPLVGPLAALLVVAVLFRFDRVDLA